MTVDLQTLGRTLKRVQHMHHRKLDSRLHEIGTTLVQWDALRAIEQHPNSSSHDLAVATFQADQSFGTLANRLVERGLIERVAGSGRAIRHHLTADGEAMLRRGGRVVNETLEMSFSALSDSERKGLGGLLRRMLDSETD